MKQLLDKRNYVSALSSAQVGDIFPISLALSRKTLKDFFVETGRVVSLIQREKQNFKTLVKVMPCPQVLEKLPDSKIQDFLEFWVRNFESEARTWCLENQWGDVDREYLLTEATIDEFFDAISSSYDGGLQQFYLDSKEL